MRQIPEDLADHLAGDVTTVCQCWRVTRKDGTVLGLTEHDRDLSFAGLTYRAASGFQASDAEMGSGLATEASEIAGGFSSAAISEADLVAGRYDGARVEVFLVDWQHPERRMLLWSSPRSYRPGDVGSAPYFGFRRRLKRNHSPVMPDLIRHPARSSP
ncbi:DUF2163 domain-containing protein [Rhizobium sp. ARZ01]|uniref:DUF2163 domain-containing protein n=1 Tax=Rhizobium sp. ARZ01 TaxID=2769313 RepID=UPI001780A035|nr:DUF2163 domain-containing protein [Rhizobium sp. ARZ01]MBD9371533.1 DUF2163 domain-containing protein [Rhizobium sp. ARZ01]